jgi:hypothetical protein
LGSPVLSAQSGASHPDRFPWVNYNYPSVTDDFYYETVHVEGISLENARNNALDDILTRLATQAGIDVTGSIKQELRSSLTESSYSETESTVKTNEVKFNTFHALFHKVHEYSITKDGKCELWVLYEVSKSGKPFKPYIPKYTTHYGLDAGWRSAILPGWGQFHKGNITKGILFLTTEVASLSGWVYCEMKRSDNIRLSQETTNLSTVKEYRNRADSWALKRNIFIGTTAGIYVFNLLDATLSKGKIRYAWIPDNLHLSTSEDWGNYYCGISINF